MAFETFLTVCDERGHKTNALGMLTHLSKHPRQRNSLNHIPSSTIPYERKHKEPKCPPEIPEP